jgi:DnaJ-class molecular chaperone
MPKCEKCGGRGRYLVATWAGPSLAWCHVCRGRGLVDEPDDCPTCSGSGWCFNGLCDYDCPDCWGSGKRNVKNETWKVRRRPR